MEPLISCGIIEMFEMSEMLVGTFWFYPRNLSRIPFSTNRGQGYDADKLNCQLNISGPLQEVQLLSSLGINEERQNHKSRFFLKRSQGAINLSG